MTGEFYRYTGEFGYELSVAIPYANALNMANKLSSTCAVEDTQPLYFFSPCHIETQDQRDEKKDYDGIPYHLAEYISKRYLNDKDWIPPDYKSKYYNNVFVFDKPILVIGNKCNKNVHTLNGEQCISLEMLDWIIRAYKDKYEIIYNRMHGEEGYIDYGDDDLIRKYGVTHIDDLTIDGSRCLTQLMLYANTNNFISVQGGQAVLCSYFNGKNIIYAKYGKEVAFNDYKNNYHRFSEAKIYHVLDDESLKKTILEQL